MPHGPRVISSCSFLTVTVPLQLVPSTRRAHTVSARPAIVIATPDKAKMSDCGTICMVSQANGRDWTVSNAAAAASGRIWPARDASDSRRCTGLTPRAVIIQ